jgi:hypothetical protein
MLCNHYITVYIKDGGRGCSKILVSKYYGVASMRIDVCPQNLNFANLLEVLKKMTRTLSHDIL